MKKVIQWSLLLVILVTSITACQKEGTGGKAEVSLYIKHHGVLIPGAKVYIKYGAKEFPGKDPASYDESKVAGIDAHSKGHSHFKELKKGDYYIYAVGYDSTISTTVAGGLAIKIQKKDEKLEHDISVTEE